MPFDMATLTDFMPMDHKTVQPVPAKALKIFDETGTEIPGWHRVTNGLTGATLRVAPESYSLVQNDVAINAIETALRDSTLDLTDARFGVDYSHDGARMWAQWLLPAHTRVVKAGVEASLRIILLNSYDGSSALFGRTGSYNWACANQAVGGKDFAQFRFTHAGKIDLKPAVTRLTRAAEDHVEETRRWERWPGITVTDREARAAIATLPKATESVIDNLVHEWLRARDDDPVQGGANLWCLYNVLTRWASDKAGGGANLAFRNWDRAEKVAEVVGGRVWTELASA